MATIAMRNAVGRKNETGDPARLCFSATSEGWDDAQLKGYTASTTGRAGRVQWGSALK